MVPPWNSGNTARCYAQAITHVRSSVCIRMPCPSALILVRVPVWNYGGLHGEGCAVVLTNTAPAGKQTVPPWNAAPVNGLANDQRIGSTVELSLDVCAGFESLVSGVRRSICLW